jgi:DNA primase
MLGIENIDVTKPVIMVEGMLDTLRAKAVGIDNVVAIGGTGVNIRQMELIKELGIKKINLCLDNDTAGKEATKHIANMLIENNSDIKISEIKLPSSIKDLDQLIQEKGTEAAKDVIEGSQKINQYELQEAKELQVLDKFAKEKDGYEYELEYRG